MRLDESKTFFMRAMKHWHKLIREVEDVPSLVVFKARLDTALRNLVYWKVSLSITEELELDSL